MRSGLFCWESMTWQPYQTFQAPVKANAETPKRYLSEVEKWSCRKLAETRKGLREQKLPYPLRRRWQDFTLVIEAGYTEKV